MDRHQVRKILQHLQSMQSESDSDSDFDPTEFTSSDDEFYDSTEEVEIDMSSLGSPMRKRTGGDPPGYRRS
eukprot:COSAG02_NODE_18767_length_920_cov_1.032887_2_plen_71_part_00